MRKKRKICIFTGTRAEYGLLSHVIEKVKNHKKLILQLIVTGTHLSKEFGNTYQEIEDDGFKIDKKLKILESGDTDMSTIKSMSNGLIKFSNALKSLKPDIVVLLGDRFEILPMASASMIMKIPIAHIHGGESTEGLIDEAIRHSVTKMSHLHFVTTEKYRNTVIQLGEQKNRVFNFGAPGIEKIKRMIFYKKEELERLLKIKFNKRNLMITYHPVTLENLSSKSDFSKLLDSLKKINDCNFIFTKANADPDGKIINKLIDSFVRKFPNTSYVFDSLGQKKYFSCLKYVDGVVGNSSSGIIEAPSFKIGTVNIGDRQKGRIKSKSVIDCKANKIEIINSINLLFDKNFKKRIRNFKNPYGSGSTSEKIVRVLETVDTNNLLKKKFNFL